MTDEEIGTNDLRERLIARDEQWDRHEGDQVFTAGDALLMQDAAAEIWRLRFALALIVDWSRAYPLSVFPEPDLAKAHELLKAGGMTLDAISAHAMRHVITGVGEIAREALDEKSKR